SALPWKTAYRPLHKYYLSNSFSKMQASLLHGNRLGLPGQSGCQASAVKHVHVNCAFYFRAFSGPRRVGEPAAVQLSRRSPVFQQAARKVDIQLQQNPSDALQTTAPGVSCNPAKTGSVARTACLVVAAMCLAGALPGAASAAAAAAGSNPVSGLLSFILHLDKHLAALIAQHGPTSVYGLLFGIVFAETGLVLTPFLPGDSLLFAAGAFAGMGQLDVAVLCAVFIVAAILGDALNYAVGAKIGKAAVDRGIVSQEHIAKTEKFYDKYGGKTVVLARFVPIVRTFAPFVAGIGSMPYGKFAWYNVAGALLWTFLFVGAGFFFGNLPFVRHNFTLVVLGIVAVSVVPVVYEIWAARREAAQEAAEKQQRKAAGGEEPGTGSSSGGDKPKFA
ncbi:hypothetical protein Agub_g6382, partial [Astrephomene gubernaculifera]